jgi:hypothetical protein
VISDELQDRSGRFRDPTGSRNVQMTAAADRRHKPENPLQRDTFATENVAMSDLSTFHDKNQAR